MGLDLALGIIILVAAFRGWFQGFVTQAVRIGGLIACVYAADPVRDFAKPRVLPYLPSIQPDLVDRILWWVSAVVSYVVLVGITTLVIKMTRRPEIPGIPPSSRNDQFAGFFLGGAKGLLIAALLAAGIQKYAMNEIKNVTWAEEQAKGSLALKWNEQYHPVAKIRSSAPVQHFVNHVLRMGLQNPTEPSQSQAAEAEERDPASQTAHRQSDMRGSATQQAETESHSSSPSSPSSSSGESHALGAEIEKDLRDIKSELAGRGRDAN